MFMDEQSQESYEVEPTILTPHFCYNIFEIL